MGRASFSSLDLAKQSLDKDCHILWVDSEGEENDKLAASEGLDEGERLGD